MRSEAADETIGRHANEVIADVLKELLGYDGPVSDSVGPATVKGWDSVAHISIIEELESRLGIRFTTEEMVEMDGVGAMRERILRHGSAAPRG